MSAGGAHDGPAPRTESGGSSCAAPERAALALTRRLVLAHGWNSTAYQILNPGLARWFAPAGDATVAFVSHRGVSVVAGAPVCAHERLPAVVAEFEAARTARGDRVCYFAAGHRLERLLRDRPGRATVLLGAQPVWDPARFGARARAHPSLRAQLQRAPNKGVTVAEWPCARATAHPALRRLLGEWLAGRGLPPLHFLVEPQTLGRLWDRRVFVAERAGAPIAFLVASPVPARAGWLVEQFVRGRGAPNGTSELMVDAAMAALARDGARWVTLGLAPLGTRAGITAPPMPRWLRLTFAGVRAHGRRFYNFDGLDAFKAKLRPEAWEGVYAISAERAFSPRTLHAVVAAFSGGSAVALLARALLRAAREEVRRAAARPR